MKGWEYLIAQMDERYVLCHEPLNYPERYWVSLEQIGQDGWELCSVLPSIDEATPLARAIFKRPKSFDAMDALINTGHIDADTGTPCPPIESTI